MPTYTGICVKSVTLAGNTKNGSNCWDYRFTDVSISVAASPSSQPYYYYGNSGRSYPDQNRGNSA